MIDRRQVEAVLRANGVPSTSPDEEIRSILLSAKWDENQVDTALTILKENTNSHQTHVDTLHKIFRSDETLSPEEISSLLGIDVIIPAGSRSNNKHRRGLSVSLSVIIIIASFLIAFGSIGYVMYSQKIGPFYAPTPHSSPLSR